MPIDLRKAIADRQERDAIKRACNFAREGANAFQPPPDQLVGFHALQMRLIAAIEAGADDYTDGMSVLGAVMNTVTGIMGYAIASLPMSANVSAQAYWEEVGKKALRTYKACGRASLDDQAKASADAAKVEKPSTDLSSQ